ncbi:Rrf2 family transcriptional regulator [bacterium]|nr:Rrf2 family transcriptional regulator [bacterium]
MKISTKGKYSLQLILYLAQNTNSGYISLTDISNKINISKKYLEQIVQLLNKAGILNANRGFQGGYKLRLKPDEITVYDVLKITETSFLKEDYKEIENFALKSVLNGLNNVISDYLKNITIEDIMNKETERLLNDYMI